MVNKEQDSVWEIEDYALNNETFNDKPICRIDSKELTDVSAVALFVRPPKDKYGPFDHDNYRYLYDSRISLAVVTAFHELLNYNSLAAVDTLVLGWWGGRYTDSTDIYDFCGLLLEHEARFPDLKALFIGCDADDDNWAGLDIHDIPIAKVGAFLNYFTQLESFKVRGAPTPPNQGDQLYMQKPDHLKVFFEEPINHLNLKKLVIETADMDLQTIDNLAKSKLPKLEHLELWFGAFYDISDQEKVEEKMLNSIEQLLKNSFPSLRYLGLKNSCQSNDVAKIVARSPMISQLDELDLSLGNLTDSGARELYISPYLNNLKKLNISHHSIKKAGVCHLLETKIPAVDYRLHSYQHFDEEGERYNIFMYE